MDTGLKVIRFAWESVDLSLRILPSEPQSNRTIWFGMIIAIQLRVATKRYKTHIAVISISTVLCQFCAQMAFGINNKTDPSYCGKALPKEDQQWLVQEESEATLVMERDSMGINQNIQTRIPYLYLEPGRTIIHGLKLHFFVVRDAGKIVGVAKLERSPHRDDVYWINFISVDADYRNKGIGKNLVLALYQFARSNHIMLQHSEYTSDGAQYLPGVHQSMRELFPDVRVLSRDEEPN
jgi:GNAT superfamily N-acetyltransferase